jgi:insulysin
LVHDPEADSAACCVDVQVGCSLDPKEFQGTAHFLEHMLFLGSKKYPVENDYKVYIKDNGGAANAATSLTNTYFYFDVSNPAFEGALDRISQFFVDPLMHEESTNREMNAVDSEYKRNTSNEERRLWTLRMLNSNPDSLFNRFSTGNL